MEFLPYIYQDLFPRVLQLFTSPWLHKESLWIVLSTIFIAVLIELYFGRHKSEELGWNTAFSNSISLLWIGIILLRVIFEGNNLVMLVSDPILLRKLSIMGIFLFWVFLLLFFNFFHILPKRFAFLISSATFINPLAYVLISIVLGDFPLNRTTSLAALILFAIIAGLLYFVKFIMPTSKYSQFILKKREIKEKKMRAIKNGVRTKKIKKIIGKLKRE